MFIVCLVCDLAFDNCFACDQVLTSPSLELKVKEYDEQGFVFTSILTESIEMDLARLHLCFCLEKA